ncbi:MAG TPA: uracil-DNA glycosylase family protein [Herpetosiphonaceae bacterium]
MAPASADPVNSPDQSLPLAAGCARCPQRAAERRQIVHGYGDRAARVLFVGTAPDWHGANQTGVPWTRSPVGRRMQVILAALGLGRPDELESDHPRLDGVYLTYLVRCATRADRMPAAGEVARCAGYLWRELELIKPQIVVPVGPLPTRILCAKLLETVPGDDRDLHAQVFPVGRLLLVPMIEAALLTLPEANAFARVLSALLPDG